MGAAYLVASGAARFAVDYLRINSPVWLGLSAAQLWSLALTGQLDGPKALDVTPGG